ncbi:DUF2200 domain-containing protein [Agrococcus sp. SGAir0287]|uniref:DUF2200 domain-containing protein n=1 Tax=Agrococcus sp. SGAir0287 TaxID=2070347 RepID=UPI0010CD24B6|nr:DUF2200 domain-containing protein [Agrococcus sp. SGAir0287]QCR19123.1 DUF2200 domain-containing protein [Agrococcus sp. SGAir0287]
MAEHRIFRMPFASVYPHYVAKVERKGRTVAELHEVIAWLTGYDEAGIATALADERSFRDFFGLAPVMHPAAAAITGVICGVRVEDIDDPLTQQIRWLDKLVDELAKGRPMEKVLRQVPAAS